MTMQEWPDDKLDEFFRKASEELNPQFEPDDWNNLKGRLSQDDSRMGLWTRFKSLFILLGVLLVSMTIWFVVSRETDPLIPQTGNSKQIQGSEGQNDIGYAKSAENMNDDLQKADSSIQGNASLKSSEVNKPLEKRDESNKTISYLPVEKLLEGKALEVPKNTKIDSENNKSENNKAVVESQKILSRQLVNASGVHSEPVRNEAADRDDGTTLLQPKNEEILPVLQPNKPEVLLDSVQVLVEDNSGTHFEGIDTFLSVKPTITNQSLLSETEEITTDSVKEYQSDEVKSGRLSIRLSVAPEMNAVTFPDFSFLSLAAKLLVEYRIMPRTYIQAGIANSSKSYCAFPDDYTWPDRWKQPILPESVDGTCKIMEIPINIRYNFIEREKMNWMVTGGVSNYRMLNEKYTYNYKRPDPGIKWYKWEGETGWYWASHLNLSVGLERKLGNRFSLITEPYLKVPVKKVGFGKINLYSTGVWFSVKYNLR